jgi:hypothetical protein
MSVIELIREAAAKREAQFRYAAAYDKFATLEQRHSGKNHIEAIVAHDYAVRCLRAYRAEIDDPAPISDKEADHRNREGYWP